MSERDEYIQELEDTIDQLNDKRLILETRSTRVTNELTKCREDAALVVYALNCAIQLIESLITYTPEGTVLHPGVATCKTALDQAMHAITGRR